MTRAAFRGILARTALGLVACAAVALSLGVGRAWAGGPPVLKTTVVAVPSVFSPDHAEKCSRPNGNFALCDTYEVIVQNIGGSATEGELTISDQLPLGVTLTAAGETGTIEGLPEHTMTCEAASVSCVYGGSLAPSAWVMMQLRVVVAEGFAGPLVDHASASGGGAVGEATATSETTVGPAAGPFGFNDFGFEPTNEAGLGDVQAGEHPYRLTVTAILQSQLGRERRGFEAAEAIESVKDLVFYLPLGFFGNPQVLPHCSAALLSETSGGNDSACPPNSQVGVILPGIFGGITPINATPSHGSAIYNVEPEKGFPAEFGFLDNGVLVTLYASVVRREGTYQIRIAVPGIPRTSRLFGAITTFFGSISEDFLTVEGEPAERQLGAFLTNPVNCAGGGASASVEANTWENPGRWTSSTTTAFPQLSGCELLRFFPALSARPVTTQADEPSGYTINLGVPQAPDLAPDLATPPLRDVSISLPPGVSISPAAADGLGACLSTGPEGINIEGPESEAIGADGLGHPEPGHCPSSSRLGSVQITSPLLAEKLQGHLFLAEPRCGGAGQLACGEADAQNGNLFSLYLEAEAPIAGVNIKLQGTASVDPASGRVTASFEDNPQFPVGDLVVEMDGGPRAPLANPQTCGTVSTTSDIAPWSAPVTPDATPGDSFSVDWDGHGGACPSQPFAPAFDAGTIDSLGGAFSPFTLTLARADREQSLYSLATHLPPGLLAMVSKVSECPEPQAAGGTCGAESQIGTTTVGVGSGSHPYYVQGRVYFTGPYGGAPFGLTVVVPAVAGPFNLGNVIVRVALFIDPHDASASAVSDPFPQKLDGVPLRLRTINVTLNRPEFTFNPTNCSKLAVSSVVNSTQGASATVSSQFGATGCKNLPFSPSFAVSTQAKTSKLDGASLRVKVAYKPGQANIRKVAVDLPKQLPSRLATLQKACLDKVFEANPAACPAESLVGTAVAHTPVLKSALAGPAYLVSHGGAEFPDLVIVLQGEGVTLDLDGQTKIKNGITSSIFSTVPDAPVSAFELVLPEGPHSALATNLPASAKRNLCSANLVMPTTIAGQNGAQVTQSTRITVTGCRPSLSIIKVKKKAKSSILVSVDTTARGRMRITGAGVRTRTKTDLSPGVHSFIVPLTRPGHEARRLGKVAIVKVSLAVGKTLLIRTKAIRL